MRLRFESAPEALFSASAVTLVARPGWTRLQPTSLLHRGSVQS
jgi:hypothetical protein